MTSGYEQIKVQEEEADKIDIPNNKFAKLMYYLKCVFTIIHSEIGKRYTNYNNYYLISKFEEQTILNLVYRFNAKLMMDFNLFRIEPDFVPIGKENEFYDISDIRFVGKIKSEIKINGGSRKVLKIMSCTESWINKYYEEPLKEYKNPKEIEKNISDDLFNYDKRNSYFHKCKNCFYNPNGLLFRCFSGLFKCIAIIFGIIFSLIFLIFFILKFLHDNHYIK